MNFSEMKKEQKQVIILVGLLSIGVLYALWRFVLVPAGTTFKESRAEVEELDSKLETADRTIARESVIREELQSTASTLNDANRQYIPPLANTLSWVTENVYRYAREAGVDVQSVSPMQNRRVPWAKSEKLDRAFVPYAVRVVVRCGYFDLVRLLKEVEANNPYATVADITIAGSSSDPEEHLINFTIEWPMWKPGTSPENIKQVPDNGRGGTNPAEEQAG